jgi:hypothetical protein
MKGILCAGLLVSLQSMTAAHAYEADIHYSTTYVLARAVGWSQSDALTIASANQAMDENPDTVAALEADATRSPSLAGSFASSLRQAEKNLMFHCFSRTRGPGDRISADVRKVISDRFAEVPDRDESPRTNTRRLIALGVALHCQQDAYSHAGFGGSCGSHSGSCYGHMHQTFLDQVVFSLLGKHHFNPDHPGVTGEWLLQALQGSVSELSKRRPKGSLRSIPANALVALSDALRGSGLDLPDDVRRACNRHIAGKWLFDFLKSGSSTKSHSDTPETLGFEVASTCKNASLASATTVDIPEPRFPRLNADASPFLVKADGSYQLVRIRDFSVSSPHIHADGHATPSPNYTARAARVQFSHWTQLLVLPRQCVKSRRPAQTYCARAEKS